MARNTSCIAGAWPSIRASASGRGVAPFPRGFRRPRGGSVHRLGTSKGLGRYSNAPPWKARRRAVQVGIGGHDDHRQARQALLTLASRSMPEPPGMRMSLTSTCGVVVCRAAAPTRADELRTANARAPAPFEHLSGSIGRRRRSDGFHAQITHCALPDGRRLLSGIRILNAVRPGGAVAFDRALMLLHGSAPA